MKKSLASYRLWIPLGVLALIVVLSSGTVDTSEPVYYHDWHDLPAVQGGGDGSVENPLPSGSNGVFTGSGRCAGCHGSDPTGIASVTEEGEDVNVVDDWQPTMMANSAKDPFWKAKVTHEISVNPSHAADLQNKCTTCHAPMGHFAAMYNGAQFYNLDSLAMDSLGRDGVSCNACHQQDPDSIGKFFSGELRYVLDTLYGPYGDGTEEIPLFTQPMTSFVGFEPVYGAHISESESCAGCHTLVTSTVDLDGNYTGGKFVEQATYHEWLNSSYADDASEFQQECQGCHFPRIDDEVVISANYVFLPGRSPYGLHYMVGGNSFMLELMQQNISELGITATEDQFDPVIDRTLDALQNESAVLEMVDQGIEDDTAYFEVTVINNTGHRFPSGYPSRRAYIEVVATDADGNTLWQSGVMGADYEVSGQNEDWEPHYQTITEQDQVQIYEMVLGDVNGDVTTVLERADASIKDNRLAPLGFSTSHPSYDTTLVVGAALTDLDWNHDELGTEGTGGDKLYYHIPLDGYVGEFTVQARLMYQSTPPKWMEEMFSFETEEIELFEEMYWDVGPDAVEVDIESITQTVVGVDETAVYTSLYPNPTSDGRIVVQHGGQQDIQIDVFTAGGQWVHTWGGNGQQTELQLPDAAGAYVVVVRSSAGTWTDRVLRR